MWRAGDFGFMMAKLSPVKKRQREQEKDRLKDRVDIRENNRRRQTRSKHEREHCICSVFKDFASFLITM